MASIPTYPTVVVNEIDLSTRVSNGNVTSFGAMAINSEWGPAEQVYLVDTEKTLVDTFGKPSTSANTYIDFFVATNFLAYSASLNVVRVVDDNARNASMGSTAPLVKNSEDFENQIDSGTLTGSNGTFFAKYPGAKGNSLYVEIANYTISLDSNVGYISESLQTEVELGPWRNYVSTIPGTSTHASEVGGQYDEVHVLVFDNLGYFTGVAGTLLEKFEYLSLASDAKKEDGTTNFYKDVINTSSRYIYAGTPLSYDDYFASNTASTIYDSFELVEGEEAHGAQGNPLTDGVDVDSSTVGIYSSAYELFEDKKDVTISHLIAGNVPPAVTQTLITLAENRGDCVVYASPSWDDVKPGQTQSAISTNIINYKTSDLAADSSYCFIDGNWKYQYDKYNDVNRWIPCCGDTAGLKAKAELENDAWSNGSGYTRGLLRNTIKLAWNPKETYMGEIYKKSVNPIISEGGRFVLLGDKTSLTKPSAFDRINVRSLFNTLKTNISDYLKYGLFDFNDEFTREQLKSHVEVYLQSVKSRRGIEAFQVVCDESNNTGTITDNNQLVMDVYVKPTKSINWIVLNMVNVGSSVSFNEVIGKI